MRSFLLVLSVGCLVTLLSAQPNSREIFHYPGKTLRSQLLPTDRIVTVTREFEGLVTIGTPTVPQEVDSAIDFSNLVFVGEDVSEQSTLIDNDSWIGTEIRFRVIEVLRGSGRESEITTVTWPAGELKIDHALVRAGLIWRPSIGKRFLVFVKDGGPASTSWFRRTPLIIEQGRLVNPWQRDGVIKTSDVLHGLSLKEVTRLIERVKR